MIFIFLQLRIDYLIYNSLLFVWLTFIFISKLARSKENSKRFKNYLHLRLSRFLLQLFWIRNKIKPITKNKKLYPWAGEAVLVEKSFRILKFPWKLLRTIASFEQSSRWTNNILSLDVWLSACRYINISCFCYLCSIEKQKQPRKQKLPPAPLASLQSMPEYNTRSLARIIYM